ncbi:MAG TPA: endonuclease/exonuclease/phosphatase family protein [Oscillospiraceae bacterium]|nr:endonuclease/exonuclease/phosphatase family protein [Oscillospiraceae bacterium]HPK36351.1 endonuclease/exonuclease/phosphatase family protein [Oscillospiraceae bacterium]HPR76702.1 endonuclease/exonuclease/phosphatase family protein [Oscillospiraceae bacterium]
MIFKFMTYNIQHGNRHLHDVIDLEMVADVIRKFDPDVVTLNEVRDGGDNPGYFHQTERIAKLLGYPHYYFARAITFPDGGDYGNAIISKIPYKSVKIIKIPDPQVKDEDVYYETRCLLKAEFGGFTVLSTHMGLARAEAKNAVATVLANTGSEPTVLMGDFNLEPNDPILEPIFAAYTDTATLLKDQTLKSWPSDAPRIKIDYVFAKGVKKILSADIPQIVATDHCPHLAEMEL